MNITENLLNLLDNFLDFFEAASKSEFLKPVWVIFDIAAIAFFAYVRNVFA